MTFSSFCYSEEDDEGRRFYEGQQRVSGPALYPHNTYHGPGLGYNQHQRTPLAQANFRPLKFTDTPVNHYNPRVEDEQGLQDHDEVPKTKLIFFLSFIEIFITAINRSVSSAPTGGHRPWFRPPTLHSHT